MLYFHLADSSKILGKIIENPKAHHAGKFDPIFIIYHARVEYERDPEVLCAFFSVYKIKTTEQCLHDLIENGAFSFRKINIQ